MDDVVKIAEGLTDAQREAWQNTVLVTVGTEPQRRAFLRGFNRQGLEYFKVVSGKMRKNYNLGLAVRAHLEGAEHG